MKKKGIYLLFSLLSLSLHLPLQAMPSFFIPDQTVESGVFINANVKVTGFTDIVGMQFSIAWDSTVLRFIGLQDLALDIDEDANFGTNNASNGALGFFWFDEATIGVSLDDSTTLFSIKFEVVGESNDSTFIDFADFPTSREVLGSNLDTVSAAYQQGKILVDPISSTYSRQIPKWITINPSFPNPFRENTYVIIELDQPIELEILLYNDHGQLIYREQRVLRSGEQSLALEQQLFQSAGIYYLKIQSSTFLVTQKLTFF